VLEVLDIFRQLFVRRGRNKGQQRMENSTHGCIVGCCSSGTGYTSVVPRWTDSGQRRIERGWHRTDFESVQSLQVANLAAKWHADDGKCLVLSARNAATDTDAGTLRGTLPMESGGKICKIWTSRRV
jgi:hypothetical protein